MTFVKSFGARARVQQQSGYDEYDAPDEEPPRRAALDRAPSAPGGDGPRDVHEEKDRAEEVHRQRGGLERRVEEHDDRHAQPWGSGGDDDDPAGPRKGSGRTLWGAEHPI